MRLSVIISPSIRYATGAALVTAILVASGWAVSVGGYATLIFVLIGTGALCALAVFQRAAFIGVLVLAAMNGIPFIDSSQSIASHIALQDLACLTLIGAAAAWTIADVQPTPAPRVARVVSWCGLALVLWCAFTVARTSVAGHATMLGAIRFGRDFLYFGALLMFLPRVRLTWRDVEMLLAVLLAGVCVFSVGQIVTVEGIANPTFLVHAASTGQTLGLTRVFAPMNDLLFAGAAAGVAAIALVRGKAQLVAIPVTLLMMTSLVVQLTRARWIALILSIVVASLWLTLGAERRVAIRLRRRLAVLIPSLAGGLAILLVVAPGAIAAGPLVQRLLSIFTDVGSQTGSIASRRHTANMLASMLGGKWPVGLGLIPPKAHYYLNLPSGSLRNPDVGVLNAVITVGVVGAALIYLPLVVVLIHCIRGARTGLPRPWLAYGGQIWILAAIASSLTLITLFSVSGLMLTAVILAVLCQSSVTGTAVRAQGASP